MKPLQLIAAALTITLSACVIPLPAPVMQDTYHKPLLNQSWQITELGSQAVDANNHAAIRFDSAGRFTATTGCNRLFGQYQATKNRHLGFASIASTRMACADMSVEEMMRHALGHTDNYRIIGSTLLMTDIQGNTVLRAQAVKPQ